MFFSGYRSKQRSDQGEPAAAEIRQPILTCKYRLPPVAGRHQSRSGARDCQGHLLQRPSPLTASPFRRGRRLARPAARQVILMSSEPPQ